MKNCNFKVYINDFLGQYDKDSVRLIFEELDKSKSGKINVDEFLDSISEKYNSKTCFQTFYNVIFQELTGKSEKIIEKLKKIKQKLSNDIESIEDLDWSFLINCRIITSICDSDIYEPDISQINCINQQSKKNSISSIGTDYLRQNSQISDKQAKESNSLKVTFDNDYKKANENM